MARSRSVLFGKYQRPQTLLHSFRRYIRNSENSECASNSRCVVRSSSEILTNDNLNDRKCRMSAKFLRCPTFLDYIASFFLATTRFAYVAWTTNIHSQTRSFCKCIPPQQKFGRMLAWSPIPKDLKPCAIYPSWPRMEALPFPGRAASPELVPTRRCFIPKKTSLPSS